MHIDAGMITLKFKSSQFILVPSCGFLLNLEEDSNFCPWCLAPHRIPSAQLSQLPLCPLTSSRALQKCQPLCHFPEPPAVASALDLVSCSSWGSDISFSERLFLTQQLKELLVHQHTVTVEPLGLAQRLLLGGCMSSVCSLKDVSAAGS